jgi:hypothetical protein
MEITILAGSTAKIPFPRNDRNRPDSGIPEEYMEDCKELHPLLNLTFKFINGMFSF